eukprot:TRINITY_DN2098_c0_g1_i3.p1 TRINITY_DN2098_c0_g1~~TRINITY_DN2098_c0_g1_i3.p1  ORF type:complete len:361 (+),score=61.80 TRINITY_DN2098_c0_g1_i3:206-1288(+)
MTVAVSAPFLPDNMYLFLVLVVLMGVFSSVCFGTLFQLVTLFPKSVTSFLSLGYASPGLILPFVSIAVFGVDHKNDTPLAVIVYFGFVASIVFTGLIAFVTLLMYSWDDLNAKSTTPSKPKRFNINASDREPLLNSSPEDQGPINGSIQDTPEDIDALPQFSDVNPDASTNDIDNTPVGENAPIDSIAVLTTQLSNTVLIKNIWKCILSMFILMISRLIVFTLLTYVPKQKDDLSQMLVFINLGADLGGRLLTLIINFSDPFFAFNLILALTLVQFSSLAIVGLYIFTHIIPRSDLGVEIFVGLFSLTTGYLQTQAYAYAPLQTKPRFKIQVAALMNVSAQIGNLLALAVGFVIRFVVFK